MSGLVLEMLRACQICLLCFVIFHVGILCQEKGINDMCHTLHCEVHEKLNRVCSGSICAHNVKISDQFSLSEMSTDGKLVLPKLPTNVLEWPNWIKMVEQECIQFKMKIKNAQGLYESTSFYLFYLAGKFWKKDLDLWSVEEANFKQFTASNIKENCEKIPTEDFRFLKNEDSKQYMKDEDVHRTMQTAFNGAIVAAVADNETLKRKISGLSKTIKAIDIYQGVRMWKAVLFEIERVIKSKLSKFLNGGLQLGEILAQKTVISASDLHEAIDKLQQYVETLELAGLDEAERVIVEPFLRALRKHLHPLIVQAASQLISDEEFSVDSLREIYSDTMPVEDEEASESSGSAAFAQPQNSILKAVSAMFAEGDKQAKEQRAAAFVSLVTGNSNPAESTRRYSTEEQSVFILKLKADLKAERAENDKLREENARLKSKLDSKAPTKPEQYRGGMFRGRGKRGGFANRSGRQQNVEADLAEEEAEKSPAMTEARKTFAAFMAEVPELSDDEETNDSSTSATANLGQVADEKPQNIQPDPAESDQAQPDSSRMETESNSRKEGNKQETLKDPGNEQSTPKGSRNEQSTPKILLLEVVKLLILGFFVILLYPSACKDCLGGYLTSLLQQWNVLHLDLVTVISAAIGFNFLPGRFRYGCCFLPFVVIILWFCGSKIGARAETIDIQILGGPPTLLERKFIPSGFATPVTEAFLTQMGDQSNFEFIWANDTGCTRHIGEDRASFKTYKSVNINVTVAKKGVCMKAIGVGDVDLHCVNNLGEQCVVQLKDVLHVPEAQKNLISVACLAQDGYQSVFPSVQPIFAAGLYLPKKKQAAQVYVPYQVVNNLFYLSSRNDLCDEQGPITRSNKYIVWSRKLGHMSLETLRQTKNCVSGLDELSETRFPKNYISKDIKIGKMQHVDMPKATGTRADRPMAGIHWDTLGPTSTCSINGHKYCTILTCDHSSFSWAYGHNSTDQIPGILEKFFADTAALQEKHGPILWVRRDNASVNVSKTVELLLLKRNIRSETSNPYEPWQNGTPERMIQTVVGTARTVMLASGLVGRFWFHALLYAVYIHNIQYSGVTKTSPHVLMFGEKPDVSADQQFGVEGWLYRREDQRKDKKFDSRGEPCIFVGYPTHQKGYMVWCQERGPNSIVSTSNVTFGNRCPKSKRPDVEIIQGSANEIKLPEKPAVLNLEEVHKSFDLQVVGTCEGNFVVADSNFSGFRILPPHKVLDVLTFTHTNHLAAAHLSFVDSFALYTATLPADVFAQEVSMDASIPRNLEEALSPRFIGEFGPAIDKENGGFQKHNCFKPVTLPPGARTLPGQWLFSRKRDGSAKARFVIGGHRQILGKDYFVFKNYCSVLTSRDNRILLALAASQNWRIYQTDIVQAFLHGVLDDVDIYIQPPARFPCPIGFVLKLLKAIYGLHQAPVKFKQEVINWFKEHGYLPANDAETIWILRDSKGNVLIHALYADDFLHFTDNDSLYQEFQKKFKKRFDVKSGSVSVYLGNKISVNSQKQTVSLSQSEFSLELLERFGMLESTPVPTPLVARLHASEDEERLSSEDHEKYRTIVGSLLYLACWSRPDISLAV